MAWWWKMNNPRDKILLPEIQVIITDALMLLTRRQREAVELWSYGCPQAEIAREMHITRQGVSWLLVSARKKLKNL